MSTSPPPPPRPVNLAMLTTVLCVTFVVAFGLCAVGFTAGNRVGFLIPFSLIIEGLCLIGLLTVGITGLIRLVRRKD